MKHIKNIAQIGSVALLLTVVLAAQQSGSTTQQQNQSMQGMEGMHGQMHQGQHGQMHGMMQDCHKNMKAMQQSNARTRRDIESAKESNDPAKMRAALDEADKALTAMDDHMDSCMSMMKMMQGMHGKDMTSGQQSSPPKQ